MRGRSYLPDDAKRGWLWIIGGMGVCGGLALLSKEIGILLPLYALAIEITVFSSSSLIRRQKTALLVLLCVPVLALLTYLAWDWGARLQSFELREFSLYERLLTEAVVVVDYLRQIVSPQLSGLGIFHDDYPVSKGLFSPVSTIVSIFIITGLMSFAVWSRKRWPLLGLGILWFFFGHSLEAGPIALELYFEHRNYLPLLGPLIAICSLLPLLSTKLRRFLPLVLILFIAMECFLTWQSAASWGNEDRLMQTSLLEHPDSLRAQQYVANRYIIHGQYEDALATQERLAAKYPEHTSTRLSILNLRCLLDEASATQVSATLDFVKRSKFDINVAAYFGPLMSNAAATNCDTLGYAEVDALFDSLLRNPNMVRNSALRGAAHYFKGMSYQQRGNLMAALDELDLSYAAKPEIDIRFQQIVWLLAAGRPDDADRYLILARQYDKEHVLRRNLRETDLAILQQTIDEARQAIE
jgi:tetratricopeptide (TPR) repeat protein